MEGTHGKSLSERAADPANIRTDDSVRDVLAWSIEHYGEAGMSRYAALVLQAEDDLAANPGRTGVATLKSGVLIYPLRHSARRVPTNPKIRNPPHSVLARVLPDDSLVVLAIIGKGALPDKHARVAERDARSRPGFASER